jgi:hypothetical protein
MSSPGSGPSQSPEAITSVGGCLLNIFAEFVGVMLLAVLAVFILLRPAWQLSWLDVVYGVVAVGVPLARNAAARGNPNGAPAKVLATWLGVAAVAWFAANMVHLK